MDISAEAVELARDAVLGAELHVAPVHDLPFQDSSFDVAVLNDVLQHVDEDEVDAGLRELRRVLRRTECFSCGRTADATRDGSGRTGGSTTARSRPSPRRRASASFASRAVNAVLSMWGAARGRGPTAPTPTTCGIPAQALEPRRTPGRTPLGLEGALRHSTLSLPHGHTLVAVAAPG